MSPVKIKWGSLMNIPDLDMEGDGPRDLVLEDKIQVSLAWLTALSRSERKLVRCDALGALLMSDPWNGLNPVDNGTNEVTANVEDTVIWTQENKGTLISTGQYLVQVFFRRVVGAADEIVYIPGSAMYWFPHSLYSIRMRTVPYATGGTAVHGLTAFN